MAKQKKNKFHLDSLSESSNLPKAVEFDKSITVECEELIAFLTSDILGEKEFAQFGEMFKGYICKHERLLYSAISKFIRNLPDDKVETLRINSEKLFIDTASLRGLNKSMVLKLYDYIHLSLSQFIEMSTVKSQIKTDITNLTTDLNAATRQAESATSTVKDLQKDYITILGIFASIVLGFTSGLVFDSSILANIHKNELSDIICISIVLMQGNVHLVLILLQSIQKIYNDSDWGYPQWLKKLNIISFAIFLSCSGLVCPFVNMVKNLFIH